MRADPSSELAHRIADRLHGTGPHLVGVAGPVAVGKSSVAQNLSDTLHELGRRPHVLGTDAFLYPNSVLEERGLTYRKGFPESFDVDVLLAVLRRIVSGTRKVEVPIYSHATYDVVAGRVDVIEGADVIVLEGVNSLQDPMRDSIDVGIYVHADEAHVRQWYVRRFEAHVEAARDDATSFYRGFASMAPGEIRTIAEATWDGINAPNLRQHIEPTRASADFVVHKDADHRIVWIEER